MLWFKLFINIFKTLYFYHKSVLLNVSHLYKVIRYMILRNFIANWYVSSNWRSNNINIRHLFDITYVASHFKKNHHFIIFIHFYFLLKDMTLCFASSIILLPLFTLVRKTICIRVCTCGLNKNIKRNFGSSLFKKISFVTINFEKKKEISQ